jgi:hypothetical protein
MLQVWLDDSGKEQMPAFVLAGYVAPLDNWCDFSDAWKVLLAKPPRALEYLKYYEAFGLRYQFKGWKPSERDARLLEFVPIIASTSAKGIAFVVDHAAFEMIIRDAPNTPFKTPYTLAYFLSLCAILPTVQDAFPTEKVEIIFDEGVVNPHEAGTAYQHLFTLAPNLAAMLADRPRFENDKLQMPLQAADLLAGCVRASHDPDPKYDRVRKSPFLPALRDIVTAQVMVDAEQMQYWRNRVERNIPRVAGITKATRW